MPGTEQRTTLIPDSREPVSTATASLRPEETVTYELKRETATVTVPVSKATSTDGLFQALKARADALQAEANGHGVAAIAAPSTPPPLPAPRADENSSGDDVIVLGPEPDTWSDTDHQVLRRFANRAAES